MRRAALALTVALALVGGVAGCGDDGDDDETGASSTTVTSTTAPPSTAAPDPEGTSTTPATGPAEGPDTTIPPEQLPGEPIDIYPYEGDVLSVVGVAAADRLNIRSGPGTDFAVVGQADRVPSLLVATGTNRLVDDAIWVAVEVAGTTGWVNGHYLAEEGPTADIAAEVGEVAAPTIEALAQAVAATRVPDGEGPTPTVTIVAGPSSTEVTVDVIGLADDAQKGERLLITAEPGDDGLTVAEVVSIALCARGVSDDGLCV